MNLYWHGDNCVSIQNSDAELVVDPQDIEKELKSAKSAEVFLLSSGQKLSKTASKSSSFIIDMPGEYDTKGFFVMGLHDVVDTVTYIVESEGIRVCHLPGVKKELTDEQLENISDVDILVIDIGNGSDANEIAAKVVNQIEPRIVIPVGYESAKPPKTFLEEMGASENEQQNKFSIKKKDLPQEETEVVILNVSK
jgi:L-ascorbate metabolism protein UlaG (beta-lactamase superfamily)